MWATNQEPSLSQGDVYLDVVLAPSVYPAIGLTKRDFPGKIQAWVPTDRWTPDRSGSSHCLAKGKVFPVLVVTHSCQIDKGESVGGILVAPIRILAEVVNEKHRDDIINNKRKSQVPLLDLPGLGDAYADLRGIGPVNRPALNPTRRIAQLDQAGRELLHEHLIAFFLDAVAQT